MFRRLLHQTEDQSVTPLGFISRRPPSRTIEDGLRMSRGRFRFHPWLPPD